MPVEVKVNIQLRPHQLAAYRARKRFDIRVWHRRSGKTFAAVAEQVSDALTTSRRDWRGYYIAPTFKQAKGISWDYVKDFTAQLPGTQANEAELKVDLVNGSRIQLLGAETYNSLRGLYADSVVVDETGLVPSEAWSLAVLPMLADRGGRALVQGTPMGRQNLFHNLYEEAQAHPDEWSASLLTVHDTDALPADEVERLRRRLSEAEFAQELLCSWNAALRGAYYAQEMARAEAEGRITSVRYDAELPVTAALDLGWSDLMACVFVQVAGTEHRVIHSTAYQATSIGDMVTDWRKLGFPVHSVILPHDAKVHELGSGTTREAVFRQLGLTTYLAPRQSVHEGIEQVRAILKHAWFDREGTKTLREALLAYRSEFDEVRNVHRATPIHDWSSHWADALRTYATGRVALTDWGPLPLPVWRRWRRTG